VIVHLPAEIAAAGYRLRALEATGSTNEEALNAARAGDPGLLWITAREQLAGRGRHGRSWASPPGNLYASLLLVAPCELREAAQLGFIAGLSLHEAVEATTGTGFSRLALKWPNDLLLDGAKLSGLLLEAHRLAPGEAPAIVIGFGVNVASSPQDAPYPTAALRQIDARVTPASLFRALAGSFARNFTLWQQDRDAGLDAFARVRRGWLARAAALGETVSVRLPAGTRTGTFTGLDVAGRLQLRTASGVESIDAGDLFWPSGRPISSA
jgi:BirA family transcriptional regulator, biotin operon repressor / biotin---[acetyl-CoA-carboxylase] ligase